MKKILLFICIVFSNAAFSQAKKLSTGGVTVAGQPLFSSADHSGNLLYVHNFTQIGTDNSNGNDILSFAFVNYNTGTKQVEGQFTLSGIEASPGNSQSIRFATDIDGNIYTIEPNSQRIVRFRGPFSDGSIHPVDLVFTLPQTTGFANDLVFDKSGNLWIAASDAVQFSSTVFKLNQNLLLANANVTNQILAYLPI